MDRPTTSLHDAIGRHEGDQYEHHGEQEEDPNFLATRVPRRLPTTGTADGERSRRPNQPEGDTTNNTNIRQQGAMESPASIPAMNSSWDEQSDDGEGSRRDRRKSAEATTPTLVDEVDYMYDEEEEQEMISYERERLRLTSRAFYGKGEDSNVRRTPGAQMYSSHFVNQQSMRRTPGASQMHRSAVAAAIPQESGSGDISGLGFGLTLSTPVASAPGANPLSLSTAWEGSPAAHGAQKEMGSPSDQVNRPPLPAGATSRDPRGAFVTPWNLAKTSSRFERGQGAFSPNTLRLTEDLGNLLLEDESADSSREATNKLAFDSKNSTSTFGRPAGADSELEGSESWTASYVIGMDAPSRVPRSSSNRGRKGKTDGSRRSRGYDRSSAAMRHFDEHGSSKTGGFLQYAQQPKAVRSVQPQPFEEEITADQIDFSTPEPRPSYAYLGSNTLEAEGAAGPRLLNFGGAFAPPPKNQGSGGFHRPVPSTSAQGHTGTFMQPPIPGVQPSFQGNNIPFGAPAFHNSFQQQQEQHFQPQFQQHGPPQFGLQQHGQTQFSGPQTKFQFVANHPTASQSPPFNLPPHNMGYPMHGGGMHPPQPQDFMPNMHGMHHQHQQVQLPQFGSPQVWPQVVEMQYDGMAQPPPMDHRNWHGGHSGWPMGEYGYGMLRSSDTPPLSMTPAQAWTPEPELVAIHPQSNLFTAPQQIGAHGASPSPGPGSKNSKKNQRKGTKKAAKNQSKTEKGQKLESGGHSMTGKKSPSLKKTRKKQSKDRSTPPVQGSTPTSTEEISKAAPEDPAEAKRAELSETPATRTAFKDFYRKFRAEERLSFESAESFATQALSDGSLPESIHWKIYLELADLAKRANKFGEARNRYQQVCHLQPYASQGWLDFSKLEEECGNMVICAKILRAGLEYCQYNENLLSRAIKHEEKMGNLSRARELLSRLKHVGIEKVWRTVLEGALLEARAGNDVMARRVLKYLMHHVPWYGPLYLEAYKLEKDLGHAQEALEVVERGLEAIPRYGPLWFGAFRLCEQLDHASRQFRLPRSISMIDRATFSISKELIWKVHLEAAQMLERSAAEYLDATTDPTAQAIVDVSRQRFAMTILTCPPNLRWKVWLASGRMEVAAGNQDRARSLFLRAHKVVPDKGRAVALLECARLEEFVGDVDLAKAILCKSRSVSGSDWKVWLESVLLEIRCGNRGRAIELAKLALQLHSGTGRLWASLVQLRHHEEGEASQFDTLKLALNAVPKSGEVWCEGARIHLNPFARAFDIPSACRLLSFATKFTPQFGDGFLETLRLEILDQWLVPISKLVWEATRNQLVLDEDSNKDNEASKYLYKVAQALHIICDESALDISTEPVIDKGAARLARSQLKPAYRDKMLDISSLRQRCANADPNYGSLWFHCRTGPTGTARDVLMRAMDLMLTEIRHFAHIYLSALIRRFAILSRFDRDMERKSVSDGNESSSYPHNSARWEDSTREAYLSAPSLEEILEAGDANNQNTTGMDLLESTMTGSNFVSGLVALSNQVPQEEMTLSDKRKALFGTDALFS